MDKVEIVDVVKMCAKGLLVDLSEEKLQKIANKLIYSDGLKQFVREMEDLIFAETEIE